jgi:hypothetical protein
MTRTKYKYYLANDTFIEYTFSPDIDLVDLIYQIVQAYYENKKHSPSFVFVSPAIFSMLQQQFFILNRRSPFSAISTDGYNSIYIWSSVGPIMVMVKAETDFPIFAGTAQEYKDNNFTITMNGILSE